MGKTYRDPGRRHRSRDASQPIDKTHGNRTKWSERRNKKQHEHKEERLARKAEVGRLINGKEE